MNPEPTKASKQSIENLIRNSAAAIDELYISLKTGLAARAMCNAATPAVYTLTQDLRNGSLPTPYPLRAAGRQPC